MTNFAVIIILFIAGSIITIGDLYLKKWAINNAWAYYGKGMIFWLIGANLLAYTFKSKDIAVASVIYVVFNVLTLMAAGYWLFGEQITMLKVVGVILALISIAVLSIA